MAPAERETPPRIPGVAIAELLGAGGFGAVWLARRGGVELAVKVARGAAPAFRERFEREAGALRAVGPPSVPLLHDHGVLDDGRPYLAMEPLPGSTVAAFLAGREAPPPLDVARAHAVAILDSLAAIHRHGIVHRDLKPANVFLRPDGTAAILDFGLARAATRDELTSSGVIVGSPRYIAPEQLRGDRAVSPRADLYSFGAILYELLTLRPPFDGDAATIEHAHLVLRPARPGALRPLPPALDELVLALLAKRPEERPPDAATVRERLVAACAQAVAPSAVAPVAAAAPADREPMVLLWVETRGSGAAVADAVQRRGGWLARQRGRRYLAAFASRATDDPLGAALAAGRAIASGEGGRAAIHLAPVQLRARPGGVPALAGEAIDRPESWLPPGDEGSVVMTAALGRGAEPPLYGRADVVEGLARRAERAFADGSPALCTLIGERGLGKSRVLAEVARRLLVRAIALGGEATAAALWGALGAAGALPDDAQQARLALGAALRAAAAPGGLAVLVDDAQRADDVLLDALEVATWGGAGVPLWVIVAAPPVFAELRPRWGLRADRHERVELAPLELGDAMALAAQLLLPAEYPPAAVLRQLAEWTGRNPLYLVEAARAMKAAGLVRRRVGAEGHILATERVDELAAPPLLDWLAARELGALPARLAACAQLVAVVGPDVTAVELEGVYRAAERAGELGAAVDAGVGLAELCKAGVLQEDGARYRWRHPLVADAAVRLLSGEQRARFAAHALAFWREQPGALAAVARHAAAAGERAVAADAHIALGEAARAAHRALEADKHLTHALAFVDDGDGARRLRALAARGRVRYRVDRIPEAVTDLAAARGLATEAGDRALEAELLLEEATALDWIDAYDRSAERVERAAALIDGLGDPRLAIRLAVGRGRSAWRAGRPAEAGALLEDAAARATAAGDEESRIIALLLLAPIRVTAERFADAEAGLDEVLERCARSGDRLHTMAAYANRCFLAYCRDSMESGLADLRRVVDIARDEGHPFFECRMSLNLAELMFWSGDGAECLALARRARMLEERFNGSVVPGTALLVARILAAVGDGDGAARELAWVRAYAAEPGWQRRDRLLFSAVDGAGDWPALVAEARAELPPEELLEILYWWRRREPERAAEIAVEAEPLLARRPFWRGRF